MELNLAVELHKNLLLPNPLIIASGPSVKDDEDIVKGLEAGAGGVVTKTITYDVNMQVQPKPRMHVIDKHSALARTKFYSFYSVDLMSQHPPEQWVELIKQAKNEIKRKKLEGIVITSIAGRTYEEWEKLAKLMTEAGADAIELNLSCPHVDPSRPELMGRAVVSNPEIVTNIVKRVKENTNLPVIGKLTPHGANPLEVAKTMVKAGVDILVSTARFQGLVIDVDEMKPTLWGGLGGYGGPWQLPISLAWTYSIAKELPQIPIIGSGGIASGLDIVKFILVGAKATQICTTIIVHGYSIIKVLLSELTNWMIKHEFRSIEEFRGKAIAKVLTLDRFNRKKIYRFEILKNKCRNCKVCIKACPYRAILDMGIEPPIIDEDKCDNCGLCQSICPYDAIEVKYIVRLI